MTITQPRPQTDNHPCPKCNGRVSRLERDDLGIIRTCATCGRCTYMDQEGKIIEELERPEEKRSMMKNDSTQQTPSAAVTEHPEENAPEGPMHGPEIPGINIGQIGCEENTGRERQEDGENQADGEQHQQEEEDNPRGEDTPQVEDEPQEENTPQVEDTPQVGDNPQEENTPQMEDTAQVEGCPECHAASSPRERLHNQRMPMRECGECGAWYANPDSPSDLSIREEIIGITMQLTCAGNNNKETTNAINRLLEGKTIADNTVLYWTQRYAIPAAEEAEKTKAQTGNTWAIEGLNIKQRGRSHWCWAIADTTTQYILATGTSETPEPSRKLLQQAQRTSSEEPKMITIAGDTPAISGSIRRAFPNCATSRNNREMEPDQSLERLRQTMTNRFKENTKAKIKTEMLENTLRAKAMSINLFEPSPALAGLTPAEAAGVETPFSNWRELADWQTKRNKDKKWGRKTQGQQTEGEEIKEAEGEPQTELNEITEQPGPTAEAGMNGVTERPGPTDEAETEAEAKTEAEAETEASTTDIPQEPEGKEMQTAAEAEKNQLQVEHTMNELSELIHQIEGRRDLLMEQLQDTMEELHSVETTIKLVEARRDKHPA